MKKIFMIFFIIGSLLLAGSLYSIFRQNNFINNSRHAVGTVIDYNISYSEDSKGKEKHYYHPIVEFVEYSGNKITFESNLGSGSPSYNKGEQVEILYNPNNPLDASINSFMSLWFFSLIIGIFGAVFFLIGLIFFIVVRRKKRLAQELLNNGKCIQATIESVELNTSLKVNGRSPYVIYSQWVNKFEADTVYVFRSENIWFNPTQYITTKTISVFIDEKNPHRYYVDIRFLPKIK